MGAVGSYAAPTDSGGGAPERAHESARRMPGYERSSVDGVAIFGNEERPRMSRDETIWMKQCEEAEAYEDGLLQAIADGVISEREDAFLRIGARNNTQVHDRNAHVVALSTSYLNGGEPARANYHSQVNKRQRLNQSAGYRTLGEGRAADTQSPG
jgi:hypothetical protein